MQKTNFNRILILILIIQCLIFFFIKKTYSPDYIAYFIRYYRSHIYLFGDINNQFYIIFFDRKELTEYSWLSINFLSPPYRFASINFNIFFDLILFLFSNARIDYDAFLNIILIFNTIILFFFLKKILSLSKYSNCSYVSLIIFFLFISNMFLEFYFIRIKSGLCFSFLFLSYIFFRNNITLSIISFLVSFFIHPFYSVLFIVFIFIPFLLKLMKKKIIIYSMAVITSFLLIILLYLINITLVMSHKIHILRMIAYFLFPSIIFTYLIIKRYNFYKIYSEKFFIIIFFLFIFGMTLASLFINKGFSAETLLRTFGFLSIPAIIYFVKINNIRKSLLYNYIILVNFILFFKSFFLGSI